MWAQVDAARLATRGAFASPVRTITSACAIAAHVASAGRLHSSALVKQCCRRTDKRARWRAIRASRSRVACAPPSCAGSTASSGKREHEPVFVFANMPGSQRKSSWQRRPSACAREGRSLAVCATRTVASSSDSPVSRCPSPMWNAAKLICARIAPPAADAKPGARGGNANASDGGTNPPGPPARLSIKLRPGTPTSDSACKPSSAPVTSCVASAIATSTPRAGALCGATTCRWRANARALAGAPPRRSTHAQRRCTGMSSSCTGRMTCELPSGKPPLGSPADDLPPRYWGTRSSESAWLGAPVNRASAYSFSTALSSSMSSVGVLPSR